MQVAQERQGKKKINQLAKDLADYQHFSYVRICSIPQVLCLQSKMNATNETILLRKSQKTIQVRLSEQCKTQFLSSSIFAVFQEILSQRRCACEEDFWKNKRKLAGPPFMLGNRHLQASFCPHFELSITKFSKKKYLKTNFSTQIYALF